MKIKVILTIINFLIIYFLLVKPILLLKNSSDIKAKLKLEVKNLKNLEIEKEKILKNSTVEAKELLLKKAKLMEEKKRLVFQSEYEVFKFIDETSNENRVTIEVIGREIKTEKDLDSVEGTFFYHGIGKELDIYNFILQVEEEKRHITLKNESILIEMNGDVLNLKMNIMYMFNNKNEKLDYDYYNDNTFKQNKSREIGKKRRVI